MNEAYDAVSMVAKKVAGLPLNTPGTLKEAAKLAGANAILTMAVRWAQEMNYLPDYTWQVS